MGEHGGRSGEVEPELSVVIPTHNRSSILKTTLEHLLASPASRSYEVVVVANACTDDTSALVADIAVASPVRIRVVEEARPSASVARNRGAEAAAGELLVFLDDDILLEPNALEMIMAWFDSSDRCSLLVGQVLPLPEHLATPFGSFRQRAFGSASRELPEADVDWYASGLAVLPAKVFGDVGGYAEDYPGAGLEDADFGIRARRAGHRIVFHPAVIGLHNDWAGTTARDFCRRAAAYCATAPLLADRFPDNDHPWRTLVEVNGPPVSSDTRATRLRKHVKATAVRLAADRWLPAAADWTSLPRWPREGLYRASISVASFSGYQRGLRDLAEPETALGGGARPSAASGSHELSIVIVSFNCVEEVDRALDALQRHPPSASHEVLVIDNASQDGTVERLVERFPEVKVIPLDENLGYGSAVNLAVKETDGQYLLLLNPDTEATAGSIDTLLRNARTSPQAGVVGPRLVLGTGAPQSSARRLPSPWRLWFEVLRLHLLLPRSARSHILGGTYSAQDEPGEVDWISGACHLVPRHVWEKVGGLTERTFCGFDDLDYCWRARDAGFKTLFCPESVIIHHCGVSVSRRWTAREVDKLAMHNGYVVLEDHWPRFKVKLYCMAELAGTVSDVLLGPRRKNLKGSDATEYRGAAGERLWLLVLLLLGRVRPIERHEPGRIAEEHQH